MPLYLVAKLGAAVGGVNDAGGGTNISGSRQAEYFELEAILDNQQNSSILQFSEVKNRIEAVCLILWLAGFLFCIAVKIVKIGKARKKIKEQYIGIHSSVSIGKKSVPVIMTENIGPMVYGIKPAIYVPEEFVDRDVFHSILLHEQAHIIRKHHLLLLLIDAAGCVYWFLPYYEKVFLQALREDMEYRCDYEVIRNTDVNPKEYTLHYAIVNGYQSGLKVPLNFSREQAMKRIRRVLDFRVSRKKSAGMSFLLGITVLAGVMWIANAYLKPDMNGFTKWEIKQAKETVINIINAANKGDEQRVLRYIYESGPLGSVTDFSDVQYDLYYIDYFPSTSNYYEQKYREQHQIQETGIIHLEGIFQIEMSEQIWGFTLIFDKTEGAWKLYDWGE
jgi:beta-lactamase regulating signal transducer with metallopeptidase domain